MYGMDMGDALLLSGMLGVPAYYFTRRGINNMNARYGNLNDRLLRVSMEAPDTSPEYKEASVKENKRFNDFRAQREKVAFDIGSALGALAILGPTVGAASNLIPTSDAARNTIMGSALNPLGATYRGLAKVTEAPAQVLGYKAYQTMFPGIKGMLSYTQAPETALTSSLQGFGSELGKSTASGLGSMIGSMLASTRSAVVDSPRRKAILEDLRKEDGIIKKMPLKEALEAYHSMVQVAPTLSTDKNAVRSFLRTVAVAPGGGVDWNTLKGLSEAEVALKRAKGELK